MREIEGGGKIELELFQFVGHYVILLIFWHSLLKTLTDSSSVACTGTL